jgi:hypothetical protein
VVLAQAAFCVRNRQMFSLYFIVPFLQDNISSSFSTFSAISLFFLLQSLLPNDKDQIVICLLETSSNNLQNPPHTSTMVAKQRKTKIATYSRLVTKLLRKGL